MLYKDTTLIFTPTVSEMKNENQTCQPDDSVLLKEIENSNNAVSRLLNDCTDMVKRNKLVINFVGLRSNLHAIQVHELIHVQVLNVQTSNYMRETKRRDEEQRLKVSRTAFLKEEAIKTKAQFGEELSKWDSISKLNDSVDVYNALENQKST